MNPFFLLFSILAIGTLTYAYWVGERPERWSATLIAAMIGIDFLYHRVIGESSYVSIDLWHLLVDLAALCFVVWLALGADRIWPLFFAAFQLVTTLGHLFRLVRVEMPEIVYAILIRAPSYLMIATLLVGTALHHRRMRHRNDALPG